ncbi:hypothetical protein HJFPF1_04668 [Paramyrothecium foliicola]|nr:hypothetical protein HJFPF1_04668 [Paramyrothecium foliicola]
MFGDSHSRNEGGGLNITIDDVPPPPYTETDIYSNSGGPRSPNPSSFGGPAIASDNASHVSSSSAGEVILTPPETPRPSASPQEPAAAYFFSTRPPPPTATTTTDGPRMTLEHAIDVRADSVPEDLPYRADFADRDVSNQDWATFVNFLIPDHATRGNEAVIDRKLRSEASSDAGGRPGSRRSYAEEQLESLRDSSAESPDAAQRRRDVEATVRQWNEQFFLPRGINIRLFPTASDPNARMPGSWDAAFDRARALGEAGPSAPARRASSNGMMGKLQIDEDGIRYGDTFVVDSNQVRVGNLVLDSRGIRIGNSGEPSRGFAEQPPRPGAMHQPQHAPSPATGLYDQNQPWDERGRPGQTTGVTQARDRSTSSHSVSSDDSSSSESSIGSLPDHDDLRDEELSLYTARLRAWLARPDEMRTRAEVKQLRAELRHTRATRSSVAAPPASDLPELRRQAKTLDRQWKGLKRRQRQVRREQQREKRQRRRAEKKEKRQRRKEVRRAERDARRGRGQQPPMAPVPPEPPRVPNFTVPPVPQVPTPPGVTAPPMPCMPSMWGQSRRCNTGGGGRGGGGGGGWFGSQPFGPSWGRFTHPGPFGPCGSFSGPGHRGEHGSWGRRGGGHSVSRSGPVGPAPGDPSRAPGAWPGDDKAAAPDEGAATPPPPPPPGPASAAMYRTVEDLEAEVARRQVRASQVGSKAELAAVKAEIESLTASLEAVRMSADEAYARELASGNGY